MYYAAVALLITKDKTPKSHQGVLNLFGRHFVKNKEIDKSYALMIRVVKEMREDADYKPEIKLSKDDAKEAIEKASKFIKQCNKSTRKEINY